MASLYRFPVAISAALLATVPAFAPSTARAAGSGWSPEVHFRPLLLGSYLTLWRNVDKTPNMGGMVLTLPVGVSIDTFGWDVGPQRRVRIFSIGLFGPGVNWVGMSHLQPWYPSVLGAVSVNVVEASFGTRWPNEGDKHDVPPQLAVGFGFAAAATGELFNGDSVRGDGKSAGMVLTASWTPAGL